MYEIQSKSDFQSGATLVVRIPEEEVDKKALYTILADQPDFILPFRHRVIDGQAVFTYQIGNRSKIAYLSGNRSPSEYADLWVSILQPLLDCGDWFMTPFSFVLKSEHLYCDKNGKTVSFVYIPSVNECSDYNVLKNMVTDIAKQNRVTDIKLENKIMWAMQDFNPNEFLQVIKPYVSIYADDSEPQHIPAPELNQHEVQAAQATPKKSAPETANKHSTAASTTPINTQSKLGDMVINFSPSGKNTKIEKPKSSLFSPKKDKEVKPPREPKEKGGFFRKKKAESQEILEGAAAMQKQQDYPIEHPVYTPPANVEDGVTQIEMRDNDAPKFRYVGIGEHPRVIEVIINAGGVFTIGRFDASIGTKQSSFEFDRKTKAVSRRHVAIERNANGYFIVDLDSAAGTFIDGQKIPPNAPFKLERRCRVSFGHLGADYAWEE